MRALIRVFISFSLILVSLAPSFALEVVKVTESLKVEGTNTFMPINSTKVSMYFSKEAIKLETPLAFIIVTRNPLKVYTCESVTQTCYVTPLSRGDLRKIFPSNPKAFKQLNEMMKTMKKYMRKIGSKRIGLWNAQGYEINIEDFYRDNPNYKPKNETLEMKRIVLWITKDKSCFKALRKLEEISSAWKGTLGITSSFVNLQNPIINEYGYPVKIEGYADKGYISVTFDEIVLLDLPETAFQVPGGYKVQEQERGPESKMDNEIKVK